MGRVQRLAPSQSLGESIMPGPFQSLFMVRGDSMIPTLWDGDLILVRPTPGNHGGYERGALVVARIPPLGAHGSHKISVKRVVGLPGEYVRLGEDGSVWVEDELLHEPYLDTDPATSPHPGLSWLCCNDEYILMGDNRTDSWDSRTIGAVPASQIMGRVRLKLPTHLLSRRRRRRRDGPTSGALP